MAPPSKSSESPTARLLGSGTSGILELLLFHPVDTVAKRLMTNPNPIRAPGQPLSTTMANLNSVIFRAKATDPSVMKRYLSLFPGLGFAAGYKILQRIYKFGGQPFVNDYLKKHHGKAFGGIFGDNAKTMMHATAGSLVGIGEVVLLPLDVLKIKQQTNPGALQGRSLFQILSEAGFRGLYKGAGWTMARNAPGSFALFGGAAVVKQHVFHLSDYNAATWGQNFVASIGGAVASITVAAPLDVVKTRIQGAKFGEERGGVRIILEMVKKEGMGAFFKGLTPKVVVVGPKLVFSYTVAMTMIPWFDRMLKKDTVAT